MEVLCVDVLLIVIDFLNLKSSVNLLTSSSAMLNKYHQNKNTIIHALTFKGLVELNISPAALYRIKLARRDLSDIHKKELFKRVYKMRMHFEEHPDVSISELLVFIIDDENHFSRASHVLYDAFTVNLRIYSRALGNAISFDDAAYIITHCHHSFLTYIYRCGTIPVETLVVIILDNKMKHPENKIKSLINYYFFKHCIKRLSANGATNLNVILKCFVERNDLYYVKYILKLRDKYVQENRHNIIEYSNLINITISRDNLIALQILFEDRQKLFEEPRNNLPPILINPTSIEKMFKKGQFKCLRYIVENQLGRFLRMNRYFESMLIGLKTRKRENTCDLDWNELNILCDVLDEQQLNQLNQQRLKFLRM